MERPLPLQNNVMRCLSVLLVNGRQVFAEGRSLPVDHPRTTIAAQGLVKVVVHKIWHGARVHYVEPEQDSRAPLTLSLPASEA